MNKQIVHDALILTAFTFVLGLLLGVVYGVTKPRIEAAAQEAALESYRKVFADAFEFEPLEFDEGEADNLMAQEGYSDVIRNIQTAKDADGNVLGYVITVTAKDGSQGSITFSVGIQNDGTVNGYSITDIAETPGLGMKATEESFYSQFMNKKVDKFRVVKTEAAGENEIEAITASTITSKAMANGCNACIYYFKSVLQGGGME